MSETKTMYEDLVEQNNILINEFQQLKQENEELKKSLQKEEEINVKLAQESVEVNDRLQQKLEKIKEYAIDDKEICCNCRNLDCNKCRISRLDDILKIMEG